MPSLSTIHRVLRRRGFVTPQPQKRPRSSWIRFESDLPNETWQSDMTHWHLKDDQPVEIINFVDDYSRAALSSVAVPVATAPEVVRVFYETAALWGLPASGAQRQRCHLHDGLPGQPQRHGDRARPLGITFKHGKPYHPQTQGKVERFHLTLKKWLAKKPAMATLADLQAQIDRFVFIYNEERPHTRPGLPAHGGLARPRQGRPSRSTGSRCWPTPGSAATASTRRAVSPCAIGPSSTTSWWDARTRAIASWSWWLTST